MMVAANIRLFACGSDMDPSQFSKLYPFVVCLPVWCQSCRGLASTVRLQCRCLRTSKFSGSTLHTAFLPLKKPRMMIVEIVRMFGSAEWRYRGSFCKQLILFNPITENRQ